MNSRKFTLRDTNICKGIAIILLYIHHLFFSVDTQGMSRVDFWLLPEEIWIDISSVCKVCVAIFVFLTAYGFTVQDRCGSANVKRRYQKLMFGFAVVYIDSQIISYFTERSRIAVYGENIMDRILYSIIDMSGLSYAFGTPTYNATWWYMSLAIVLIAVVPVFVYVFDKFRYSILILTILLPRLICPGINDYELSAFVRYMPVIVLGICACRGEWFEKMSGGGQKSQKIYLVISIIMCVGLAYVRIRYGYIGVVDSVLALLICIISFLFISNLKFISSVLEILGRHSMNMFLTHSFVKAYFLNEFTYFFRWPELIVVVLVIDTLILSCLIEKEKQIICKFI